jgi:hypothetical protein
VKDGVTYADVRDFFEEYPQEEEDNEGNSTTLFFYELIFCFYFQIISSFFLIDPTLQQNLSDLPSK